MTAFLTTQNPSQRIKGQEVTVLVTQGGVLQDTLTDIQSFEVEAQFEIKSMGYLGEVSNRKDEIYNGCKFTMELHLHTQDWFNFQQQIKNKAQRLSPSLIFNISSVLSFPNGQTPSLTIPDAHFGPNPLSISSRGDYVKVKLEGESSDFVLQLT
jgi:hypothetical protein